MGRTLHHRAAGMLGVVALLCVPTGVLAQENIGTTSQPLTTSSKVTDWTGMDNTIPVCWETAGFEREKKITKRAVTNTWEWHANLRFTGWGDCPTSGSEEHVRIRIGEQGTDNAGAGGSARVGTAALSSADDNDPGMNLSFNPDGSANRGRVEYVAVHEFGHVLGFVHEQDAPGNEGPGACTDTVDTTSGAVPILPYDRDSIMNYCNRDGNGTGLLTDVDIYGVQQVYGVRYPNVPQFNTCASAPLRTQASVAAPWDDSGQATFAVFGTNGSQFTGWNQWAIQDGGWGDEVRWVSGDFNGDGLSDIGAAWNNGGENVLTIRVNAGAAFAQQHWLEHAGGWIDSTAWLAGDFNGDGLSDIAAPWNNDGLASIAVFPSDGASFPGWTQWTDRDGGWGDEVKWVAGDFNGDGRTDIMGGWNNEGSLTLTARLSQGDSFSHEHWLVNAGHWWNASTLIAGDFNKDGLDDIAHLFNDLGELSVDVALSTGSGFYDPVRWTTRDGGWGPQVRWFPGDFNGDGRTDIGAAWNNGGENVLTVRTAAKRQFNQAHWLEQAGGWLDNTAWCAGTFE